MTIGIPFGKSFVRFHGSVDLVCTDGLKPAGYMDCLSGSHQRFLNGKRLSIHFKGKQKRS